MLNLVSSRRPFWISDRQTIHKFSIRPPNNHFYKVSIQSILWFLTRKRLTFGPIRAHNWPWRPFWMVDRHQFHKSGKGPPASHFCQVWLKSVQWFQRRRSRCEKLADDNGCKVMTKAHMAFQARWAKKDKTDFFSTFCSIYMYLY